MNNLKFTSLIILLLLLINNLTLASENVVIPAGTELVGELVTPLNSKASKVGDPIVFKLAKNLVIDNAIIVQKGTSGRAVVTHAEKATYFGQGGQIGFEPEAIETANGVSIPLTFEKGENIDYAVFVEIQPMVRKEKMHFFNYGIEMTTQIPFKIIDVVNNKYLYNGKFVEKGEDSTSFGGLGNKGVVLKALEKANQQMGIVLESRLPETKAVKVEK